MNFNKISNEEFTKVVKESTSVIEVLKKLKMAPYGGNYSSFRSRAEYLGIDISHFISKSTGVRKAKKTPVEVLFSKRHKRAAGGQLKNRLLSERLKEYKCESCGNTEWMGRPIPLETHHKDGDSFNNLLENLELLCPNCHSFTDTYRGKKLKKNKNVCPICGSITSANGVKCLKCYKKQKRDNSSMPSKEVLKKELGDIKYGIWRIPPSLYQ